MEKPICNAPRGKAKTSHFARVVALVRQVATSATLPAVLALAGAASALTALGDGLPAEYQQLEFIQANGNCQIRTGITPTCTDKVEMTWRPATVSGNQNLFCSRTGTGATGQFTLFMIGDKVRFDRNTSTVTGANAISAATKYTVVADYATLAGTVTLADTGAEVTSVTMTSGDFIPGSELCLYASHTSDPNTGLNNYASYALYSFKLSDSSDNLKLDLVPAKRKADGVIGLYDAVNDAFLTNYLSGTFLAGPAVLTFNSYTWNGGASGNLSDAANWSPAPAGAFTADDELVVNDAAEITVDAAATVGKLTLNAAGAVAFTGANALTVTRIANTGTDEVTFNCPVNFSGTYYVEQTGAVKFPGGATATYPDATLRTASTLDRTLDGTFTFTEDWIVNNVGDYPWIVASNSVVRGKNFSGTQISHHRILRVEETGYACFTTVTNGWDRGDIDIDGTLEATEEVIVRTNPSGGSTASRFGRSGNIGTVKAPRIAKCEHATASSLIPNLIVGAGGFGSLTQDYSYRFDVDTTITATNSFEFLGVYRSASVADWCISMNGHVLTIVVPEGKTVTCGVSLAGNGSIVKQGAGTLVMTDTFNGQSGFVKQYANGTVIEEGKVVFAASGQLGTGPVTIGANGALEIADGISFANPIEGDGAISVAGNVTMLDGARLLAETSTFAAGAKVVVENQTTQGVIATGVSRADFDACFETSNGGLTWSDGSVSYGNCFVWVGAEGGNWSDAANWSWNGQTGTKAPLDDDYADVSFTNAATVVLDASATIQDLYFSGSGAVKIVNPAATHGFVTTNHLALATVSNSATVMPEIECKVDFAGTYKVAFTNKGVKFAGGAIATTWDSGNTLTTPTIDINGTVTFTADWTVSAAVGHKCYVRNGATLNCASLTLPYCGNAYNQLNDIHVDNGGVLNCKTLTQNGRASNFNNVGNCVTLVSDTSGIINVTGTMTQNRGGRVGTWKCGGGVRAYMEGELNLNGLVVNNTTGSEWLSFEQKKANIGPGGIVVKSTDKFTKGLIFAPWVRLGAYADYEISSEKSDPVMYLYQDLTFDTLDSVDGTTPRTIRVSVNLHDEKSQNNQYQYGYNFKGGYIIKENPGLLILSGNSTYSLGTTVNGGTVRLEHNNAAGTGAITVAAGATLELADGVTITNSVSFADGATLVCGAGSQISGPVTRDGTVNLRLLGTCTIFPSGYTDTTGFVVTSDSAVGTLSVDGGALKYDARAVGTYTWTGAVDGNFSTPGNWSVNDEAVNDVPGVLDTIRFAPEAATTVTLDADAQVAAMVIEGAGALTLANPSGETVHSLTLASVTSSATVMPVINCKVQFTDKYTVSFTNKSVNFAGGATATTWDSANTAASPTSDFYGNITFTEDWTVPSATGNKCYVKNGATLTCPTLILPYRGASYNQLALLQVDAGGTLNCRTVEQNGSTTYYNGVGNGVVVYVNGTLNVTESYNMNNCGRIGMFKQQGNNNLQATGVFNVKGIVADSTTTSPKWIEQRKLNLGADGILVKAADVTGIGIGPQITLGALADYAIRYEGTGSKVHFHAPVTFDTYDSAAATARTVTISADVEDGKSVGTYSPGRYDVGGAIIKKNAGTLVVSGYNTFTGGTTVNGGTLLAAHDHALGTGAASVGADGTLELMEGVSVTNAVTLAANATLLIDGAEARTAAGTSVVGTIATPSTGTANLKVVGDLSSATGKVSITLGALAEGASVEALALDATELTLPKAGWRARLKAREGSLVLDVKKPTGMTLIVR